MPLQSLTECFTGRQHKIFKQSWKGKQNCATWPYNIPRDTRATKHITDSTLSLLSEEHTSRLNYQPHVKHISGLSLSAYPFLQWPVTRIEILAYFPIAAAKESDVMMLSTWKEEYLLSIISFTFILPFNLKCACCPGQIPFKIFPAWNGLVYLTAPALEF